MGELGGWDMFYERVGTFSTELESWWILKTAVRTSMLKWSTTLATELNPRRIFKATAGTTHSHYP